MLKVEKTVKIFILLEDILWKLGYETLDTIDCIYMRLALSFTERCIG